MYFCARFILLLPIYRTIRVRRRRRVNYNDSRTYHDALGHNSFARIHLFHNTFAHNIHERFAEEIRRADVAVMELRTTLAPL